MPDILTIWKTGDLSADWLVSGGDLSAADDIKTAIILSLFTDIRADPSDRLPDGETERRGWWGDAGLPRGALGSRLWLLSREKATEATRQRAEAYARDALQWMISDGVAASVEVAASYHREVAGRLDVVVTIFLTSGAPQVFTFSDIAGDAAP